MEEGNISIPDVYPAYISFEQYAKNRQVLRDNMYNFKYKGRGAAREGQGLLQGILFCGRCGRRMTPTYGSDYLAYVCRRERLTYAALQSKFFCEGKINHAISHLFLQAIQP